MGLNRVPLFAVCIGCIPLSASAQETTSGISVPATISGEARKIGKSGEADSISAGFRAVLSPSARFGPHWFAYAALDVHSSAYFPYNTGADDDRAIDLELMQAFIGYVRSSSRRSILIKAGQISSAFGLFPIDYDDATMPLINAPLAYTANLPIRADQLACGVKDIIWQDYASAVADSCHGSNAPRYGLTPVTLYGLPSLEVQLSAARFDARLQITNSSPANPHGLFSESQSTQWAAGTGYTFAHGFHTGASAFRGPYLDNNLKPLLPVKTNLQSFAADGVGIDANWSHGHWSAQGEWMRFRFVLPAFIQSPSESTAYGQIKRIVTPRLFVAARVNLQGYGPIEDRSGVTATRSAASQQLYELAMGYRLSRHQLIKAGGTWQHGNAWTSTGGFWPQTERYAFELQLVTTVNAVSKAFR